MEKVLVIGAAGQIGSELTTALKGKYGTNNVIAGDIKESSSIVKVDVLNKNELGSIIDKNDITQIYHLAAVLSANCEKSPLDSWSLNMNGLFNVLELAKEKNIKKIFWPSSIGAFGPTTPKDNTPQITIMEPNNCYGISKLAGERWVEYYWNNYKLDIRGLRYPGLISYKTQPGGGTTDYAVEIFYEAIKNNKYVSFLKPQTTLPMMYIDDAVRATIELMEAPIENITVRSNYNIGAISFNPEDLAVKIRKHIPEFEIEFEPDFRQSIAESWPASIDDSIARRDWAWKPEYDLDKLVDVMITEVGRKLKVMDQ